MGIRTRLARLAELVNRQIKNFHFSTLYSGRQKKNLKFKNENATSEIFWPQYGFIRLVTLWCDICLEKKPRKKSS